MKKIDEFCIRCNSIQKHKKRTCWHKVGTEFRSDIKPLICMTCGYNPKQKVVEARQKHRKI